MAAKKKTLHIMILAGCRRAMGLVFIVDIALVMLCLALDSWASFLQVITNQIIPGTMSAFYFFWNAVIFGGVYSGYFIPMLAAIPYASSYANEHRAGMTPFLVARSGKRNYYRSKMIVSAISGGLVIAVGTILFVLLLSLKLPLVEDGIVLEVSYLPWHHLLEMGNGAGYFVIVFCRAFLNGAMWACVAMAVSAYIPNNYVTVASPFIGKFLLIRVSNLMSIPFNWRLDYWLSGRYQIGSDGISLLITTATVIIIIILCGILFTRKGIRRLENGLST